MADHPPKNVLSPRTVAAMTKSSSSTIAGAPSGQALPPPPQYPVSTNGTTGSTVSTRARANITLNKSTPKLGGDTPFDDSPTHQRPVADTQHVPQHQPVSPRAMKPEATLPGGSSIRAPMQRQDTLGASGWKRSALPTTANTPSPIPATSSATVLNSSSRSLPDTQETEQNTALRAEIVALRSEKENHFKEVRGLREEKHRLLEDIATLRASLEKYTKELRDRQDDLNATREKVAAITREVAQLKFMHEELASGTLSQSQKPFASSGGSHIGHSKSGAMLSPPPSTLNQSSRTSPRRMKEIAGAGVVADESSARNGVSFAPIADRNTPVLRKNGFW